MDARTKFRIEWNHLLEKVNWGRSALDARAIRFMNEIEARLDAIENEAKLGE